MSRACRVCQHPSRLAIDQAILNRKPLAGIALDFGFTYTDSKTGQPKGDHKVIVRHRDECIPRAVEAAMRESDTVAGAAIMARLRFLDEKVDLVLTDAERGQPVMVATLDDNGRATGEQHVLLDEDGHEVWHRTNADRTALLRGVAQARANAELIARLAGEVPEADDDDMERIRAALKSPKARALLAELDKIQADWDHAADPEPADG